MFEKVKNYFENRQGAVRKQEAREMRKAFFVQLRDVEYATRLDNLKGEEIWSDLVDACAVLVENDVPVSGPATAARLKNVTETVLQKMSENAAVTDAEFETVVTVSPSTAQLFEQYQANFLSQKDMVPLAAARSLAA